MRKFSILLFFIISLPCAMFGQKSYLVGDNVAVFYPAQFDSSAHLPSFALLAEPVIQLN